MKQHLIILLFIVLLSVTSIYFLFVSEVETPNIDTADGYLVPADEYKSSQQKNNTDNVTETAEDELDITSIVPPIITTNTANITMPQVQIETNKGIITVELYAEDAPNTVENFLTLTRDGYYDGIIFHRVISGFMIQG
jgi:preprotein translocase subunit SecF